MRAKVDQRDVSVLNWGGCQAAEQRDDRAASFGEREGHLIGCDNVVQPRVVKREPLPSFRHVDQGSLHVHIWRALSHLPTISGAFSTLHGGNHHPPID
jgi:hypothetical protein